MSKSLSELYEKYKEQPEVLEALIRTTIGTAVDVVPESSGYSEEADIIEVQSEEELAALAPELEVPELVAQLTAELPETVDDSPGYSSPETILPVAEVVDYSSEDHKLVVEEWSPLVNLMESNSNLSEDEIAALFSGET